MHPCTSRLPPAPKQNLQPPDPPQKQWYDKLADALLGSDEALVPGVNKYALICEKCFTHNGLAEPEKWQDVRE